MSTKTQKFVALTVFGLLLLAVAGSFLVSWQHGAGLVNGLRIAGVVVSVLAGFYAAGVGAAHHARTAHEVTQRKVDDGGNAFLPDGNVNRAAGSLGRGYLDLSNRSIGE
jgi:hypothetical protein